MNSKFIFVFFTIVIFTVLVQATQKSDEDKDDAKQLHAQKEHLAKSGHRHKSAGNWPKKILAAGTIATALFAPAAMATQQGPSHANLPQPLAKGKTMVVNISHAGTGEKDCVPPKPTPAEQLCIDIDDGHPYYALECSAANAIKPNCTIM